MTPPNNLPTTATDTHQYCHKPTTADQDGKTDTCPKPQADETKPKQHPNEKQPRRQPSKPVNKKPNKMQYHGVPYMLCV